MKAIARKLYLDGATFTEVANELGISENEVLDLLLDLFRECGICG